MRRQLIVALRAMAKQTKRYADKLEDEEPAL
jgi:hypothetical protein